MKDRQVATGAAGFTTEAEKAVNVSLNIMICKCQGLRKEALSAITGRGFYFRKPLFDLIILPKTFFSFSLSFTAHVV